MKSATIVISSAMALVAGAAFAQNLPHSAPGTVWTTTTSSEEDDMKKINRDCGAGQRLAKTYWRDLQNGVIGLSEPLARPIHNIDYMDYKRSCYAETLDKLREAQANREAAEEQKASEDAYVKARAHQYALDMRAKRLAEAGLAH